MPDLSLVRFNADIAKFAKQLDLDLRTIVEKLTMDLWASITRRTPVDTGRARAGWIVSVGTPDAPAPPPGKYGEPSPPSLGGITGHETVWILNNVEYIEALEDGHSQRQAPNGMVRLAIAQIELDIAAEIL